MHSHSAFWRVLPACLSLVPSMLAKVPDYVSPEVATGQATLRFYAPNAQSVSAVGFRRREPIPMAKGADGIWSVTLKDLAPDIYSYSFDVDGAIALDPHNRGVKEWITSENTVEVPGPQPADYSLQAVPHGVVHRHTYSSAVGGRELSFQVYTPPGYDPLARTKYPVVVLCHGYGDAETAWVANGRASFIADNLIARGTMKKALIVMPYGHPVPLPTTRDPEYWRRNDDAMERAVLGEVLPFVEKNYRVSREAKDRAIVGLSMGGGHALRIGLGHPDRFRWVGAFSSAAPEEGLETRFASVLAAARAKKPDTPHLYIAIGRDDFLLQRNETFTAWLKQNNIPFTWKLSDGGHEWTVWREYLADFLPPLFR